MFSRFFLSVSRVSCVGILGSMLTVVAATHAVAQRPSAPKLFPDNTLAYIRVDDSRQLKAQFEKTSIGRLKNDAQIKPILAEFYGSLVLGLENMTKDIGINLDELLSIPNGELAIAFVPTENQPVVCVLLEAGDELPPVQILLGRLERSMAQRGASRKVKAVGKIDVIAIQDANNSDRQFAYFIDKGVVVACSNVEYAEFLAKAWTGNVPGNKTLADNRLFTTIMSRSVGIAGERPQVSFYADPFAIVKESTKTNTAATLVTAMLPSLGVDGIQAIGGSMIFAPNEFDSISHTHLLLSSPRRGLLQVLRPKTGSTEPEKWVHEEVALYYTLNWNIEKTITAVRELVDIFRGPDYFEDTVIKGASRFLGVNFQKDILDQVNDRLTMVQVFLRPAQINSGASLYAVHIKDPEYFKKNTLPTIYDKIKGFVGGGNGGGKWHSENINNQLLYYMELPKQSETIRAPQICFTVIDDCFVIGDSKRALEDAIYAAAGQKEPLAKSLEFKMVLDRIKRQVGDRETSIISFQRPEESLRLFYDLAADPANKERLRGMSATNPLFAALSNALERHQLPPFETISKYLAPAGSFVIEDESGLHATSFSLRRD